MIYLLLLVLGVLCVTSFFIFKKDIIAPSFIFSLGFTIASFFAVIYAKKWELGLHLNTFLVISLGVAEFIVVSYIVKLVFKKINEKKVKGNIQSSCSKNESGYINVNKIMECLYLIFILLISGAYLYYIVKSVDGSFSSIMTIFDAMSKYDKLLKFSEQSISLPFIITNLELLVIASGYWFIYVAINNYLYTKKINIIEILIIIASIVSSMLSGSRTIAFMILFAAITIFVMLMQKKKNNNNIFTLKMVRNIVILGCIFIAVFYFSAMAWGRVAKNDKMYYFAIYCGAEIKNLDIFLQEDLKKNNEIWGSQTFYSVIQTLGKKVKIKSIHDYKLDLPFRNINGLNLGNVYTTFYPYIYDFGYIGEFLLVLIMAIISQVIYELTKNAKTNTHPLLSVLVYSNIINCLILSFFSNKFYENIISIEMIKKVIFWILLNLTFCEIDWKKIYIRLKENMYKKNRKEKSI